MLAEWFFGAAKGAKDAIYLTMSTGIGGGIVSGGHLVTGRNGQGGEVGHINMVPNGLPCGCGQHGCYEAYCGGRPIALRLRHEIEAGQESSILQFADNDINKIDMLALEQAVRAGDAYALAIWEETTEIHARAIGSLICTLNPEKVVLGTFAWAIGDLFMQPILEKLPQYAWPEMLSVCEVVPSALQRKIGSYAGIAAAFNGLYEIGELSLEDICS